MQDLLLAYDFGFTVAAAQESAVMALLRHPNVLSFLGVCPMPPCVVTEYCSRGSLADILRAAKKSPALAAKLDWARRLNMVTEGWFSSHWARSSLALGC